MLIVTRRPGEHIDVTLEDGRRITIVLIGLDRNRARIGIEAPRTIDVDRAEITKRKEKGSMPANGNLA
jgi:carbon storage regulator CsrA